MPASMLEYAVMCQQCYLPPGEQTPPPGGWSIRAHFQAPELFSATTFFRPGHTILAFRGADRWQDVPTYLARVPSSTFPAVLGYLLPQVTRSLPDACELTLTGHSTGAVLAEMAALCCERVWGAVTFESPGALPFVTGDSRFCLELQREKVLTLLAAPNPINTLQPHVGQCFRLFLPHSDRRVSLTHSLKCAFAEAQRVLAYFGGLRLGLQAATKALLAREGVAAMGLASVLLVAGHQSPPVVVDPSTGRLPPPPISHQVVATEAWLLRQHSIGRLVEALQAPQVVDAKVVSWPCGLDPPPELLSGAAVGEMLRELVPLHPGNRGLHTLLDEDGVIEYAIERLRGYSVEPRLVHRIGQQH